ncbi:MAG: glycosyltransferase [Pseudomonadota bacterium]
MGMGDTGQAGASLLDIWQAHEGKVTDKWAAYLPVYAELMQPWRDRPVRLLEIGIQNGGSLEIWARLFPNAEIIVGSDIDPLCEALDFDDPRIRFVGGDANAPDVAARIKALSPAYDIILDDGSHTSSDIIRSFGIYFGHLAEGGVYIAEDLHCSYWGHFEGGLNAPYGAMSFFKRLADYPNREFWGGGTVQEGLSYFADHWSAGFDADSLDRIGSVAFFNSMAAVHKVAPGGNALGVRTVSGQTAPVDPGPLSVAGTTIPTADEPMNVWGPRFRPSEWLVAEHPDLLAERAQIAADLAAHRTELDRHRVDVADLRAERDRIVADLAAHRTEAQAAIAVLNEDLAGTRAELDRHRVELDRNRIALRTMTAQADQLQVMLNRVRTRPLKAWRNLWKYKTFKRLAKLPLPARLVRRFADRADRRNPKRPFVLIPPSPEQTTAYDDWIRGTEARAQLTGKARAALIGRLADGPVISVVMPVYNPDPVLLSETIASIEAQSYPNWELCIADDASSDPAIRTLIEKAAARTPRIRTVFRTENGHISAATNSALALATGDYVALLDHDDLLPGDALLHMAAAIDANPDAQVLYSDEDKVNERGRRTDPHFKPDWNRDLLYAVNYISHLGVYRRDLIEAVGGMRTGFEGAQDYDLVLRCVARIRDDQIVHIPRVLYHWRISEGSTAADAGAKPYAAEAGLKALTEHVAETALPADGTRHGHESTIYRVDWALPDPAPKVCLIMPTRDGLEVTRMAVESILERTAYPDFEILIVDNGSEKPETLAWFETIQAAEPRVRVLRHAVPFNFSALNNFGVSRTDAPVLCLINNDIEAISHGWLDEMVALAMRPGTGAVGAKLYYPDGRVQHGGVIIGIGGVAGHAHKYAAGHAPGYFQRLSVRHELSAVTAACLVIRREVYEAVGGLDEENLAVAFNDVDFCLKVQATGYRNVWTPFAELTHHESVSRGLEDSPEKQARFKTEVDFMLKKWKTKTTPDPHYNVNLTLEREDFTYNV